MMSERPLLIFDVNETLLDLDSLAPYFERILGDGRTMRDWFAQVILYSEALTLAGEYTDFGAIGGAVLRMFGEIQRRNVSDEDVLDVKQAVASMPPHRDVKAGLERLKSAGFRMVTLTNNPRTTAEAQLKWGGLAAYFERMFSIDEVVRQYKPAPRVYHWVADEVGVTRSQCCLIACHVWDVLGAAATGMQTALILRPGNGRLGVGRQPDIVGSDLTAIVNELIAKHP
jgi:2-haloacid dehalogenase